MYNPKEKSFSSFRIAIILNKSIINNERIISLKHYLAINFIILIFINISRLIIFMCKIFFQRD